jgi:MFS transporter, DHA2 family, multidrug resistance protein
MQMTPFTRTIIIITTVSAAIMELIDTSIVNVALNQISGNLGATIEDASWVVTAYAIANVIIIPMTGFLAKYFGRKNYYLTSIAIFTVTSYLCGISGSLPELVLWRFLQGIGGGALLSTSQGILFDAFPIEKRGMAAGMFGLGIVIGPALGPTLGGIIVENHNWPLIFDINIPFGIVAFLLTLKFVDKKPEEYNIERSKMTIDWIGIAALTIGIGSLQYVLEKGQSNDWFDDANIRLYSLLAFVGIIGFIFWELYYQHPFINLKVLKKRNLIGTNILNFVVGFGLFGSVFVFPVMTQRLFGYSPTEAGYALVPGALAGMVCMPIIGASLGKGVKPIYFVMIGFFFFMLHGYTSSLATTDADRAWFIWPQIFRGIGTSTLIVPLIQQAVVGLSPKDMPSGIALTNMVRQLGGAFGIAVMNTYVARRFAVHRNDLLGNINLENPLVQERINGITQVAISKGSNPIDAAAVANKILDITVTKQAYLQSYLNAFQLITVFFLCALPFILMLRSKKLDAATKKLAAESAH